MQSLITKLPSKWVKMCFSYPFSNSMKTWCYESDVGGWKRKHITYIDIMTINKYKFCLEAKNANPKLLSLWAVAIYATMIKSYLHYQTLPLKWWGRVGREFATGSYGGGGGCLVVEGSRMCWLLVLVCTLNKSIFIYLLLLLLLFYIGIDVIKGLMSFLFYLEPSW